MHKRVCVITNVVESKEKSEFRIAGEHIAKT